MGPLLDSAVGVGGGRKFGGVITRTNLVTAGKFTIQLL